MHEDMELMAMMDCQHHNVVSVTVGPNGYMVSSSITDKVSDKTFQKILNRITYAERHIRASYTIDPHDNREDLDVDVIADTEDGEEI